MPYEFQFQDGDRLFTCAVPTRQCTATNKSGGTQCKRLCAIGTPFCWTHLASLKHLKVKESTIEGAGRGLFAHDPRQGQEAILFRKDQTIAEYTGEIIDQTELVDRYAQHTAPYAVQAGADRFIDAACDRCIGSIANTRPRGQNVRFSVYRGRVSLKATQNIRNGQEIFLAYGGQYRLEEPGVSHRTVQLRAPRRPPGV
jgi:hypothetical protein